MFLNLDYFLEPVPSQAEFFGEFEHFGGFCGNSFAYNQGHTSANAVAFYALQVPVHGNLHLFCGVPIYAYRAVADYVRNMLVRRLVLEVHAPVLINIYFFHIAGDFRFSGAEIPYSCFPAGMVCERYAEGCNGSSCAPDWACKKYGNVVASIRVLVYLDVRDSFGGSNEYSFSEDAYAGADCLLNKSALVPLEYFPGSKLLCNVECDFRAGHSPLFHFTDYGCDSTGAHKPFYTRCNILCNGDFDFVLRVKALPAGLLGKGINLVQVFPECFEIIHLFTV